MIDFNETILRHSEWKLRLAEYMRKPDGSLDPDWLARDDQCELGKWMLGKGRAYASFEEFEELTRLHRAFHRTAADLVHRANIGEDILPDLQRGSGSEYDLASAGIVHYLARLIERSALVELGKPA